MKLTKDQLVIVLQNIVSSVKSGDSLEGSFEYTCFAEGLALGEFELLGSIRHGALAGQGSLSIFEPSRLPG